MSKDKVIEDNVSFVRELCKENTNIDLLALCNILGISIIDTQSLDKEGYLICSDGLKLIFIDFKIQNKHKKRFIIAHEIGHFLMHRAKMYCCSDIGENRSTRTNTPFQEKQANDFASELLLPQKDVENALPIGRLHFSSISDIANRYDVSMTMTAIKAIACSKTEEEILLCYENDKLRWYASSNKYIGISQIPSTCPMIIDMESNYSKVYQYWDDIYDGAVMQEVFHPFPSQVLILLAGDRWKYIRYSY